MGENLCRNIALCTLNNQLVTQTGVQQVTVIKEFAVVKNNVVNLLVESNGLGGIGSSYSVNAIGSSCNQSAAIGSRICNGNNQINLLVAQCSISLDSGEIITIGERTLSAFPHDGVNNNRLYSNVNLERLYGIVAGIVSGENYLCISDCALHAIDNKVDGGLAERNVTVNKTIEINSGHVNSLTYVGVVIEIVLNFYLAFTCPSKIDRLDGSRNCKCLATVIGDGDKSFCIGIFAAEFSSFNRDSIATDCKSNLCRIDLVCAVIGLYPTVGLTIEGNTRVSSKGNDLGIVCCIDRKDHAANHNREHCYQSHETDEIVLACKLNLLMFHNITTFP